MSADVEFSKHYESFYGRYPKDCLQNINAEMQKKFIVTDSLKNGKVIKWATYVDLQKTDFEAGIKQLTKAFKLHNKNPYYFEILKSPRFYIKDDWSEVEQKMMIKLIIYAEFLKEEA